MAMNRQLLWYRDLLHVLVKKDLVVRYKGSSLGFFWSILNPLAYAFIFYIVFGIFMRMNVPHYIVVLLSALFPWQCFSNCVVSGVHVFSGNAILIKKVTFPRAAIPLVMNLQHYVHLILSFPIYLVFMFYENLYPSWNWIINVPIMLILMLTTTYGLSLLLGSLNVFFRDLENIVRIFMQIAFFGTPIMYIITRVSEQYYWIFMCNPAAPLFICWRDVLAYNTLNLFWFSLTVMYACLFFGLGLFTFQKLNHKFAEVI